MSENKQINWNMEIDENIYNLYTILLQYYEKLREKEHPKIKLITDIMDLLIELKERELGRSRRTEEFFKIHSMAYNNLNELYDYDKEQEELKKKKDEELKI